MVDPDCREEGPLAQEAELWEGQERTSKWGRHWPEGKGVAWE
jgi:hypothetical protein